MIFGIDVIGLILPTLLLLPETLIGFVPSLFGDLGGWAGCIAQHGAESPLCMGGIQ